MKESMIAQAGATMQRVATADLAIAQTLLKPGVTDVAAAAKLLKKPTLPIDLLVRGDAAALSGASKALLNLGGKVRTGGGVLASGLSTLERFSDNSADVHADVADLTIEPLSAGAVQGLFVYATPMVALADCGVGAALSWATDGEVKGAPLARQLDHSQRAIYALSKGVVTGDTRKAESFHSASLSGEYGWLMRQASEAGEFWSRNGVDGFSQLAAALR